MTKLPKKITPDPIVEAVIEIRFDSKAYVEQLLTVILNKYPEKNSSLNKLPINEIPEYVRESDPELRYKPLYQLSVDNEKYVILVGPRILAISAAKGKTGYIGWSDFYKEFDELFKHSLLNHDVEKIVRIGMRYINFFDSKDFWNNILLNISPEVFVQGNKVLLKVENTKEKFNTSIQIATNTKVRKRGNNEEGSIIDIDISINEEKANLDKTQIESLIQEMHLGIKTNFFGILKPEYLETLGPKYE